MRWCRVMAARHESGEVSMYGATVLDVLIASPSDTLAQRQIIRQAVIDWNISNARSFGVVLLPVMWETHSLPGLDDRPQGMISDQIVDDSDILIATFWTRLGSPTGVADSGTVEEINRCRTAGRPIHVYHCTGPFPNPISIDPVQIDSLRKYLADLSNDGLISSYATDDDLRLKVRDDLTKRIHKMQQAGVIDKPESTVTVHVFNSATTVAVRKEISRTEESRKALQGYLASWEAVYQGFNDYSVDARHDLMREVATTVLNTIRNVAMLSPAPSVVASLQDIAARATKWSTFRVYLDGGVTFDELSNGCRKILDAIRQLVDESWDQPE